MSKRKCRHCKEYRPKESMLLVPAGAFCDAGHAFQWAQNNAERKREKAIKAEKKARKEKVRNFRMKDKSHQIKLTQLEFNRMIRLLDRGKRCPTCGEILVDGQYDAGHVRTVASCPQLRFHPGACFGQCRRCNGSGTIRRRTRKTQETVCELYRQWVLSEHGQHYHDWLYGPHEFQHWTCEQLTLMRKEFSAECRRLERGEGPSRDWRAL